MQSKLILHPIIQKILTSRGLNSAEDINLFLNPSLHQLPNPFDLAGIKNATERVIQAILDKEKIVLFGDYDVDGITGSAQLALFLKEVGSFCEVVLPHRLHDGYGLSESSLKKIQDLRPSLLITIDNGTKSKEAISVLKKSNIDTIVIDHHEAPDIENLPPVVALINPKSPGQTFEKNLASAGLVFLFLIALRSQLREKGIEGPNLKRYLDLACLGTVADVVPLTGTNRIIVKFGLQELTQGHRAGIKALKEVSSIGETEEITPYHVGFRLAPRINAAGRMSHPEEALKLFLQKPEEAYSQAQKLENYNRQRQQEEERALHEAFQMIEDPVKGQLHRRGIVVGSESWPLGVVGILAARITEKFHRPAIALTYFHDQKIAKGSARSIPDFSVYAALKDIEDKMEKFGGHEAAAGMTVSMAKLEDFSESFDQSVLKLSPQPFEKKHRFDTEILFSDISSILIEQISLLEPFGMGNPEPTFITSNLKLTECRLLKDKHIKCRASQGSISFDAIYFNGADALDRIQNTSQNLTYTLQNNVWNGKTSIQLKLKNIQ